MKARANLVIAIFLLIFLGNGMVDGAVRVVKSVVATGQLPQYDADEVFTIPPRPCEMPPTYFVALSALFHTGDGGGTRSISGWFDYEYSATCAPRRYPSITWTSVGRGWICRCPAGTVVVGCEMQYKNITIYEW